MPTNTPPPFDTQQVVEELHAGEFTRGQADALVQALKAATCHLATRADLESMRVSMHADLESMRISTRSELDAMTGAIKSVRVELMAEMERQTNSLIKWIVGLAFGFAALGLAVVGTTITVLRWLGPLAP